MRFEIHNRRYIGSKATLANAIQESIPNKFRGGVFFDVFSGTGVVSNFLAPEFDAFILNDLLYSNEAIYKGFFGPGRTDWVALEKLDARARELSRRQNYFGKNFGGKYFSIADARLIGAYRQAIEDLFPQANSKTRNVALASLLYSADRSARTVGHYEAYLKAGENRGFRFDFIQPKSMKARIYRRDANALARIVQSDVAYLDPPYNSRQYSRFYHVLETLTKWDFPELHGVALKPEPENISDYSKRAAPQALLDLVSNLETRFIVISYNNTYKSKSSSSQNKISLEEINEIASTRGKVKTIEIPHKYFNAGKTHLEGHKEFLFTVEVKK